MLHFAQSHRHRLLFMLGILLLPVAPAVADLISVTIENLAPQNGTFLTPLWVGFHDGTFDLYNLGAPAGSSLERLAEDGNTGPLSALFTASGAGTLQGTIPGPSGPIGPGTSATAVFDLNNSLPSSRYFSYAAMVIPSNDAFIANGNPLAIQIFNAGGSFLGADFLVLGSSVLDAGTEVNDEIPANTAFLGQTVPNTGVDENGVVGLHPGFLPLGSGGILDDLSFANADFTDAGYQVARITIKAVPLPASLPLVVAGLSTVLLRRRSLRTPRAG